MPDLMSTAECAIFFDYFYNGLRATVGAVVCARGTSKTFVWRNKALVETNDLHKCLAHVGPTPDVVVPMTRIVRCLLYRE